MPYISVPTLVERKRYSDGMGAISTSPGAMRRGKRKRSRSRLGSLSSGALGSLGTDISALDDPSSFQLSSGGGGISSSPGDFSPNLDAITAGAMRLPGNPLTAAATLSPGGGSAGSSSDSSILSKALDFVKGLSAATRGPTPMYPPGYTPQTPVSQYMPLVLLGGAAVVAVVLIKRRKKS